MITGEFINLISKETGLLKKDVSDMLQILPKVIVEEVVKGNKVKINQMGTFVKKNYGDKTVYNPHTGKKEILPGYEKITFRVADALKKFLQNTMKNEG